MVLGAVLPLPCKDQQVRWQEMPAPLAVRAAAVAVLWDQHLRPLAVQAATAAWW